MDDIAFINSMHTSHSNHYNATLGMHTGSFTVTRPSIGAWVSYGLGTENQNLPSFIVIAPHSPYAGGQVWGSDFLPGAHRGTRVVPGNNPVPNITPRVSGKLQELELAALRRRNQQHLARQPGNPELAARMRAFETAFGMQMAVPEAFDFTQNGCYARTVRLEIWPEQRLWLAVSCGAAPGRARGSFHRIDPHRLLW